MSTTYTQTGELKTIVALTCTENHLGHGNWKSFPIASVPASSKNYTQIFVGENEGSSTICTDGYVVYEAADGTKFKLSWNCTMSGKNDISMEIFNLSGPWQHGDIHYNGRFNSSYYWEIAQKPQTFVDAPVFAKDILTAEKCRRTSQAQIEKYIDGRKCIYLKDCFSQKDMQPYEKLWCAINPLFLTPVSKSILLRELAEQVLQETGSASLRNLSDKLFNYNQHMAEGKYALSKAADLRSKLTNMLKTENDPDNQTAIEICHCLLNSDLSKGWREGVYAYLGAKDEQNFGDRQNDVLKIVEKHL